MTVSFFDFRLHPPKSEVIIFQKASQSQNMIHEFNELCERFRDPKSRVEAERKLVEFRKSRDAIEQSINIIVSKDATGFARFQATSLCRDVALERWTRLGVQQQNTIREHLLKYVVNHFNDLPKFVSKQILHTVASFYKRTWTSLSEEDVNAVFAQIQTIMRQNVRCANAYLQIIVDEFLASRSSAMGLKLEWHRNVQQRFSKSGLRRCLEMGMIQIAAIVRRSGGNQNNIILELDNADGHVLSSFLKLLTQILSFDFGDSSSSDEFVCPGPDWRDVLLERGLITILFRMYYRIRNNPKPRSNLMHACREAIISMASVRSVRALRISHILPTCNEITRIFEHTNTQTPTLEHRYTVRFSFPRMLELHMWVRFSRRPYEYSELLYVIMHFETRKLWI